MARASALCALVEVEGQRRFVFPRSSRRRFRDSEQVAIWPVVAISQSERQIRGTMAIPNPDRLHATTFDQASQSLTLLNQNPYKNLKSSNQMHAEGND
jgi:hypothetical protein